MKPTENPETPRAAALNVSTSTGSTRARVVLKVDQRPSTKLLVLGQNILLHYCLENTTADPIEISVGGDYRGATRSLRFSLKATDAQNVLMDDPDPEPFSMGGLGYSPQIKPGESWCQSLPIARYARIDMPGIYTFRVTHDLGWPAGTAPTGEIHLQLSLPKDEAEAEAVIREMEALPRDSNQSAGKISTPYPDFFALRYEVYLRPLLKRAQAGKIEAIAGIGQIPTTSATHALVDLLNHKNRDVAREAAMTLNLRLPDPALTGAIGPRGPFHNEMNEQRKYLSRVGWQPELAPSVRAAALTLMKSSAAAAADAANDQKSGAFMLEAVGVASDMPAVIEAFTAAIEQTTKTPRETGIFPTPRGACQEIARAVELLLARGATVPTSPKTPGEIGVWLVALRNNTTAAASWEAEMVRALRHSIPYVRRLALEKMPDPPRGGVLSPALVKEVGANLANSDVDVQIRAADVVERAKLTSLGPKTAAIVMTATDDWTIRSASNAASSVGSHGAVVNALIARLTDKDPKVASIALEHLLDTFEQNGRSSSSDITPAEGRTLQGAWQRFVANRRPRIDSREKMTLDDPSVPVALVPKSWRISRNGKPDWPPQ